MLSLYSAYVGATVRRFGLVPSLRGGLRVRGQGQELGSGLVRGVKA
jgi:hypothetical protein